MYGRNEIRVWETVLPGETVSESGFFLLCLVLNGECTAKDADDSFLLKAGQGVLFRPGQQTALLTGNGSRTVAVAFSEALFFNYCLAALKDCPLLMSFFVKDARGDEIPLLCFRKLSEDTLQDAENMLREYRASQEYRDPILACQLTGLLLRIMRTGWMQARVSEMPGSRLLHRMLNYLIGNFKTVTLEEMAVHFGCHPNTVSAVLKRGTGKTYGTLLNLIRMNHAAQLLSSPGITAQQAAESCGYSNMSHFYERFSACYGLTPGEYARSVREGRIPPKQEPLEMLLLKEQEEPDE